GQLTLKILLKKKLSEPLLVKDVVGLEKAGGFAGFPWLVANITRFKAYSMIYTMNHPRSNPSEKDEKVKMDTFHALLVALVKGIEREFDPARAKQSTCDVCGHAHDFVFDEVFRSILEQLQKEPSLKFPCREFFPLAGTMGGEAQTFSNMSKGPNICPRCLLMVYYLPFSSQVIEGNLAIFQLSDPRLQYLLVSRVVQKCVERINIAKPDDKIETDGKDKKHKNELVFEQLLDLFKSVLPASPTPADVKASFPGRNVDCWLWKYTNAGQGAYLSYEHIPNALVYFVYTCYCFDLHESLISMLKQELKDIKYTPKQFFNCIRGKMLYDFDKLDGRKYALDSRIVFLYYYYILGYNKPMLNAIMQIAMQVKAHLSDAGKDLKNRARVQAIIMSQARKLMQDGKISPATYHSVFGFNMQARKAKIAFDLVNQVLKLDLAAKNLDEYDTQVRQYLEGENLDLYNAAPELHVQQDEIWACHVSRMLVSYFKAKKMRGKDIIEKIVEQRMKNAPLKWFSTLLSSACLASSMAVEPVDYFYMLHIAGGWYGLRPVLQAIMTAILQYDGKDTRSIMDAIPAPVPAEFRSKNRNPSIERI
ncbi:MAG: hypothetical protein GYA24_01605, partial [Candidatus Lokiarchaeota archaeon]|nr:hypothetical protein [Candidatus Lokiarchaeota archaeon]